MFCDGIITIFSQGYIQKYEDLKRKLYNCNANICCNQKCLPHNLMPNYARIKIPNTCTPPASRYTQHKTSTIRIKDEFKYLYTKKTIKPTTLTITHTFGQLMEQPMTLYPTYIRRKTERENRIKILDCQITYTCILEYGIITIRTSECTLFY